MKTKKVLFADIEKYEKKGWVTTNEWSIKDYYVVMEKCERGDSKENLLQRD